MEVLALTLIPSFDQALNGIYVAIGLGLVIFIHELGHFAVAKWCDVKVERFSIGFGPILWKFTRGETEYALSAIPFGGYVKMLGQDDADPNQMANEKLARDPRSYTSKSVPQRMAIISAGVFNNMVSAVVFFVVAFLLGVKYQPAVIGQVEPGKPAWVANLRLGDRITRINDRTGSQLGFIDLRQAVALSGKNEYIEIEGLRDGQPFSTSVLPEAGEKLLFPTISVEPEQGLVLAEKRGSLTDSPTVPGLSAASAKPPFQFGDRLVEIEGKPLERYADLLLGMAALRDQTVTIGVLRAGQSSGDPVTQIEVEPNHFRTLGLKMAIGKIKAIQKGSPAENKGMQVGDTITSIVEADGQELRVGIDIDPLKLPDYFAKRAGETVRVKVKRDVSNGNPEPKEFPLVPEPRAGWIERARESDSPLSVPAIGVAFHVNHYVAAVDEDGPAAKAGISKDDVLLKLELVVPKGSKSAEEKEQDETISVEFGEAERNWPKAFWSIQQFPLREIHLTVKSKAGDEERKIEIAAVPDPDWYTPMRGFAMQPLFLTRKASNIGEALSLGFQHTRNSLVDMYMTIRGLTSGRISPKALGGPIRIFDTAMYFSSHGIPDLILFLGMLSVSLAVLNFMPIPVLDGGHFVFLCWEGIRGKPASDRVVITATYIGLAMVLSLMAWVIYMDISGLVKGWM
ncbi:MAG: RIP metalloprotease RseP [Planctomycetales bacterium]